MQTPCILISALLVALVGTHSQVPPTVDRARDSVCRIDVYQDDVRTGHGSGFLIDDGGWIITNHHVVDDHTRAVAVFADGVEIETELWHVDPDYDLALLRLTSPTRRSALKIAEHKPTSGARVWALGFPTSRFFATSGEVSGIHTGEELLETFGTDNSNHSPSSKWIQTDSTINTGSSGGPLVNARGEVVGVNTWQRVRADSQSDQSVYFALSAQHIASFFEERPDTPAFTLNPYEERSHNSPATREPYPIALPSIEIERDRSASQLVDSAEAFLKSVQCIRCKGAGRVTTRVRRGSCCRGRPIFANTRRSCPRCDAKGYDCRALDRHLPRIADVSVRVDYSRSTREHFQDFGEFMQKGLSKTRRCQRPISTLNGASQPGDVVFVYGSMPSSVSLSEDSPNMLMMKHAGGEVILRDMPTVTGYGSANCLATGIVAGHIEIDGERVPVLQHGLIIGH